MQKLVNGVLVDLTPEEEEARAAKTAAINSPANVKARKLAEIEAEYKRQDDALFTDYSPQERATFWKQESEAIPYKAWLDGGSVGEAPAAPYLTNLSATRETTMADTVAHVISKAAALEVASPEVLGTKQRLFDEIDAIDLEADNAVELINAIEWP